MRALNGLRLVLGIGLLLALSSCSSARPSELGMVDRRLRPCPASPNCVSSEDETNSRYVPPISCTGAPERAWEGAKTAVRAMGGTIEEESAGYLLARFTSRIFRFVDDLELRMDEERRVIHVRSASRVGYYDFGVNRRRVDELRALLRGVGGD